MIKIIHCYKNPSSYVHNVFLPHRSIWHDVMKQSWKEGRKLAQTVSTMCTVTGTSMMLGPVRLPVGMIVVVGEGSTAVTVEVREATPPPPPSLGDGDGGDDQLDDEGGSSGTARPLRPPRSA